MYLNLAAYLFADLQDLPALREELREAGKALAVRGTVLLAPEGINVFVCAAEADARAFGQRLREVPGLGSLSFKESWSGTQSFNRLLVKLKKEIITFRQPEFRPAAGRASTVDAASLARWLDRGHDDDGRPVVMVDTRNVFEVEVGAFDGAVDPRLKSFTDLPQSLESRRAELAGRRVVTYCTGGIRCEVLSALMVKRGFQEVYQMQGGIVRYGEKYGDAGLWEGSLYVFDKRMHTEFTEDAVTIGECVGCQGPTNKFENCSNPACRNLRLFCDDCAKDEELRRCPECSTVDA